MLRWYALGLVVVTSLRIQEPISIGILRQDGYLIPVATIDGNRYLPLLASSTLLENTNVFTAAAAALAGTTWTVARKAGDPIELTVFNRAMVDDHCSSEEAWRTSFKGTRVPKMSADVGKLGIAVRGAQASQPEDVTALPDEASRRIARLAAQIAAAAEAKRLAKEPDLFKEYFSARENAASIVVRKLFRHTSGGVTTYFFETAKEPLPLITSGWIVDSPEGTNVHDVNFAVNDDSYKEGRDGTVTGIVPLADRTLWLMEWHGYEWEEHAIHEWPSGRVRLRTPGVGC